MKSQIAVRRTRSILLVLVSLTLFLLIFLPIRQIFVYGDLTGEKAQALATLRKLNCVCSCMTYTEIPSACRIQHRMTDEHGHLLRKLPDVHLLRVHDAVVDVSDFDSYSNLPIDSITVEHSKITTEQLLDLLSRFPRLNCVLIEDCEIDDRILTFIRDREQMRCFGHKKTRITDQGVRELRTARPTLVVNPTWFRGD